MRGKLETQMGTWGGWWTRGADGRWPDCGECDIVEYYKGILHFNVAWWQTSNSKWRANWDMVKKPISDFNKGWADEFHIWVMDWNEDGIKLYMDGVLYNSWDSILDVPDGNDVSMEGFKQPHFLLLSQSIGGSAGGDTLDINYPTSFIVDYVRWYQRKKD